MDNSGFYAKFYFILHFKDVIVILLLVFLLICLYFQFIARLQQYDIKMMVFIIINIQFTHLNN